MMRDMKKKINPRYSVSNDGIFSSFSFCLSVRPSKPVGSSRANQTFPAVLWQELMPWDHPYLSGILRAERWAFAGLHNLVFFCFFFACCHLITASWSGPRRFVMSRRTERWCDSRLVSAGPVGTQPGVLLHSLLCLYFCIFSCWPIFF